ncbi:hypothetical protein R1sor_000801 [Riccia sorocarpa]|uniref:Uncharacterized protein n=1 Tax=Riccia sorocarpa TaxID=122646 RepID=A0ABD3GY47_9MARC
MTDTEVPGLDCPLSALLLADDVALIERSETRLWQALQHFSDWATLWGLDIGHSKCGVLPFGAPFGPFRPFLAHDGSIPLVTDYKYLGVTFTRDITQIFTGLRVPSPSLGSKKNPGTRAARVVRPPRRTINLSELVTGRDPRMDPQQRGYQQEEGLIFVGNLLSIIERVFEEPTRATDPTGAKLIFISDSSAS